MCRKIFGICVFVLLVGCDGGERGVENISQQAEGKALAPTGTEIYIQGGGGIDFGRLPESERLERETDEYKIKRFVYKFNDPSERLYAAIHEVLSEQGYESGKFEKSKKSSSYTYLKDGEKFSFVISESAIEGFSKQSTLVFWVKEKTKT